MKVEWGEKGAAPSAPALTDERKAPPPTLDRKQAPSLDLTVLEKKPKGRIARLFSPRSPKPADNSLLSFRSNPATPKSGKQPLSPKTERSLKSQRRFQRQSSDGAPSTSRNNPDPNVSSNSLQDVRVTNRGDGTSSVRLDISEVENPEPIRPPASRSRDRCVLL